jgi:uncharacterized protein YkwD
MEAVINSERSSRGLPPLSVNPALTVAAEKYAALIFAQPDPFQLSHDLNGTVGDRARAEGYYGAVGEVLAVAPNASAEGIVQMWLNSPGHAAIILGASYVEIGVGCASGPYSSADGSTWQVSVCSGMLGY